MAEHAPNQPQGDFESDSELQSAVRWRRGFWVLVTLVLAGAMLGLFGRGPLSWTVRSVEDAGGRSLQVRYERFVRAQAPTWLRVTVETPDGSGSPVAIWIDRGYFPSVRIESVSPEPIRTVDTGDGIVMEFATAPSASSLVAELRLQVEGYGGIDGGMRLMHGGVPGREIRFSQFAYP